jgi:hypothetical protein
VAIYAETAIRPTVQEVANMMPDRTTLPRSAGGGDAGTFTASTTPTEAQVNDLIDMVLDTVEVQVTEHSPTRVRRSARTIVKLQAAMLVEATYFSHQGEVNTARIDVWQAIVTRHADVLNNAESGTHDVGIA